MQLIITSGYYFASCDHCDTLSPRFHYQLDKDGDHEREDVVNSAAEAVKYLREFLNTTGWKTNEGWTSPNGMTLGETYLCPDCRLAQEKGPDNV